MKAYAYASGLVEIGRRVPKGALPLLIEGSRKKLTDFLEVVCRHGYATEVIDGRTQKKPGTECLLVPGVPEAPNPQAALDALCSFCDWIKPQAASHGLAA